MRDTRVMYVENDPALQSIMAKLLGDVDGIDVIFSTQSPQAALESDLVDIADVALLDLALGAETLNGIDLGVALRERNPNIGIVLYSQYSLRNIAKRVPESLSMGWSFIRKSGDMDIEELAEVLRLTARGLSRDDAEATIPDPNESSSSVLAQLTPRQRAVMALVVTGLSAPEIAEQLGASQDAIRKDRSRAYRVLVPDGAGKDVRTRAVLRYIEITKDESWDAI